MLRHFPMKDKPGFTTEIGEVILETLAAAPASQLSAKLKQESVNFKNRMYALQQTYDFCNYISKQPETDASCFVRALCDVTKYYQRPL